MTNTLPSEILPLPDVESGDRIPVRPPVTHGLGAMAMHNSAPQSAANADSDTSSIEKAPEWSQQAQDFFANAFEDMPDMLPSDLPAVIEGIEAVRRTSLNDYESTVDGRLYIELHLAGEDVANIAKQAGIAESDGHRIQGWVTRAASTIWRSYEPGELRVYMQRLVEAYRQDGEMTGIEPPLRLPQRRPLKVTYSDADKFDGNVQHPLNTVLPFDLYAVATGELKKEPAEWLGQRGNIFALAVSKKILVPQYVEPIIRRLEHAPGQEDVDEEQLNIALQPLRELINNWDKAPRLRQGNPEIYDALIAFLDESEPTPSIRTLANNTIEQNGRIPRPQEMALRVYAGLAELMDLNRLASSEV